MGNTEILYVIHALEDTSTADYLKIMFDFYPEFYELKSKGIPGGSNWRKDTLVNLESATACVILLSSAYSRSAIAVWETMQAIVLDKPILVVVIEKTEIPPLLAHLDSFDATVNPDEDWTKEVLEYVPSIGSRTKLQSPAYVDQLETTIKNQYEGIYFPERVFIAYSHKQKALATHIYKVLTQNGKAVFYDAKIKAGATWRQTIQKALDDATHIVVIWTADAAQSNEVEREVSYALAERKVIVPILSKEIQRLPYHLHGLHYIVLEDDLNKIKQPLLKAIEQFSANEDIWQ